MVGLVVRTLPHSKKDVDPVGQRPPYIRQAMTSVNSPACLLACNRFYKNLPPSPEQMKPAFNRQSDSVRHKHRQLALFVTMTTLPGVTGTKGLWVNIVLQSPSSLHISTSKPTGPADRGVK